MPRRRFAARLAQPPGPTDYAGAAALAGLAGTCRLFPSLDRADPALLLAAVVFAAVYGGTRPAILAAAAGLTASLLALMTRVTAGPTSGAIAGSAAEFTLICAVVIAAINQLRRVAAQATAAQARLAEVFRQIPGSAAIIEAPDGRLLMRSAKSAQVIGNPAPGLKHWDEMQAYGGLHADGRPFAAGDYPIVRALHTGEEVHGERFRYRSEGHAPIDLEVYAGPVYDPAGRIVAAVGMAFDVSARVSMEHELRDSERRCRAIAERLRAAIGAGELGLWECDLALQQFRLDARMATMLGLPAQEQELSRRTLSALIDPDGLVGAQATDAAAYAPGLYANELQVSTPAGEPRWLVTRGAAVSELGKVIGVATDVTRRHRREAALASALEANEVLMHEADHRIKNSLQLVVSLLRLQQSRVSDPYVQNALAEAIGRVDAVATAHLALQRSSDLKAVEIDAMLQDLCVRVGALNPAVCIQCAARCGLTLEAEQAIPLGLIASELLTNALRHAYAPGEPGDVTLLTDREDDLLLLEIRDAGVGMLPDLPQRGLGSSVVASLARKLGATVATTGRPGEGTCVVVRLPLGTAAVCGLSLKRP